jgi:hypothetical protein
VGCCDTVTIVSDSNSVTVIPTSTIVTVLTGGSSGGGTNTSFVNVPGSSFTGTSPDAERTYTYTSPPLPNSVSQSGRWLSPAEYDIAGNVLTIHNQLFDDDYVVFAVNT